MGQTVAGKKKHPSTTSAETALAVEPKETIRESMIEEYVLALQKKMDLSNETTRQLLSMFMLQFMLKNIQPHDFVVKNKQIVQLQGLSVHNVSQLHDFHSILCELSTPPISSSCIRVTPLDKNDLTAIDFGNVMGMAFYDTKDASVKHSTTTFDMWVRHIEQLRSMKCTGDTNNITI